jgi:DNA-binding response OmpR family regulator
MVTTENPNRILLVEDDEVISETVVFNLEKRGYKCLTAFNGLEGLRKIRQENPDILILDLMLPELDGWRLCEQVRREGFQMPIIICSARTGEMDKVRGFSLGADDYLTKPFGMGELVARVEANLRRAYKEMPAAATQKIVVGPLEIDPASREILARGKVLDLTPKEFAVLYYLAMQSPVTVTREDIYRTVWGYEMIPGNRSVDVFVKRIRKKLAKVLPGHSFLHTQYGFGYKFRQDGRGH